MSEMGSLSGCILENDPQTVGRARLLRGKALAASIGLEATVILALLGWPLLSPGILGGKLIVTPLPPYHGGGGEVVRRAEHPSPARNETPQVCRFCWNPTAPTRPSNSAAAGGDDERWRSGSWPRTWQRYRRAHNPGSRRRWTVTD